MRTTGIPVIGGLAMIAACGSSESASTSASSATSASSTGSAGGAGGAGGGGGGLPACGSAGTALDRGKLEILEFDDGTRASTLREQTFTIKKTPAQVSKDYVMNEVPVHEAVRFELTRPARVHGFELAWALPDGAAP
jgi:hypothetical protein